MMKLHFNLFFVAVVCLWGSSLHAQYVIHQEEYTVPVSYDWVPEDREFESQQDEAKFFLNLPESKLKMSVGSTEGENSIIYVSGNDVTVEGKSGSGNYTVIMNMDAGKYYYIMWPQKKIMVMTPGDLKKMQEKSQAATDMVLKNLSPEARAQYEASLKSAKSSEGHARPTGKKAKMHDFDCEQYIVEKENEVTVVWAANDIGGVTGKIQAVSSKMADAFSSGDDEDDDEWEFVPGKIPVEVRTYRVNEWGSPEMHIMAITKIEQTTPPKDKFVLPEAAKGFTKTSMSDMMQQMMNMMPDKDEN